MTDPTPTDISAKLQAVADEMGMRALVSCIADMIVHAGGPQGKGSIYYTEAEKIVGVARRFVAGERDISVALAAAESIPKGPLHMGRDAGWSYYLAARQLAWALDDVGDIGERLSIAAEYARDAVCNQHPGEKEHIWTKEAIWQLKHVEEVAGSCQIIETSRLRPSLLTGP